METLYQSLVAVEPTTLIVTILNLFLQLFIIKKFFLDKILAVIDRRRNTADAQIAEAESANAQAQELKQTYEKNLLAAKAEAGQLLQNAKKTAAQRGEEIVKDATEQAVQIRLKAEADIAQKKKKALNDAKNEIADIAMEIAGKVVGRSINTEGQAQLVDQFIDGLGDEI